MSFGFKSVNDGQYVQIDSDMPRLCKLDEGSYSAGSNYIAQNFNRPITTTEPPLVFIRPDANASGQLYYALRILGSAGNWTGFSIMAGNITYRPVGLWFAAAFASMGTDDFGMRIWDGASSLVYDSGASVVAVTFAAGSWGYAGSVRLDQSTRYKWVINHSLQDGEYMMINPFSLCAVAPTNAGADCAICADYGAGQLCLYETASTVWTDQGHRPVVCAKLVV